MNQDARRFYRQRFHERLYSLLPFSQQAHPNYIHWSCCRNSIYYSSQRSRRVYVFGTQPSLFSGCLACYFNFNRRANSSSSTNQIKSINFYDYLNVHICIYNFFLYTNSRPFQTLNYLIYRIFP
ncbi:hypothetical protein BCR33DRAFT_24813 [Rhizoclosmatium globosum]|uniref:Uncharacterized protein n=1 Tax=Rhizoclosmatium globosum TaxID=329046 RepID=A0A1Y2AXN7_9FUNG|nr:hypothetical protein BCR33DRAFT_24813 [Rhizoclosmatium globosum]|eukprot:ORY27256.1 hypothetical protein BCR33DRAFT_24813 [Rhizoclosmatium globosum]